MPDFMNGPPPPALSGGTGAGTSPSSDYASLAGATEVNMAGLTKLADQVSQSISALAQVVGASSPDAAKRLDQAKSLIADAIALYAGTQGTSGGMMPTGSQFPGRRM